MNVHMGCSVCLYAFYSIFNLFFFCGLNAQWTHNHNVWRPVSFLFILMFSNFSTRQTTKKQTRNRGSSKIESKNDNRVDFAADRLSSQEHFVLGVAHLILFLATKPPSPDQSYIFHTEDPWHCLGMFRCSVNKYIKLKLIKYNNVQMRTSVYCCGLSF